jgi:hypothetical protein
MFPEFSSQNIIARPRTETPAGRLYDTRTHEFSREIKGAAMLYRKNLPGWERAMRAVGGAAMIACGLLGLPGTPIGYLIAAAGVVTGMTGFFGFCPMCAMVGRRFPSS